MPAKAKIKNDPATLWVDRIVSHERVSPGSVIPHPMNMRRHTPKQERLMLALLESGGELAPIIVSVHTRHILDGHLRHMLATRHEIASLAAVLVDVTEDEELVILSTFDAVGFLAELDKNRIWSVSRLAMGQWGSEEISGWLSGFAPKDISVDHAANLATGDDLGDGGFGGVLRQFVFQMTIEEYELALPALVTLMERENLADSVEAISWLLDHHGG